MRLLDLFCGAGGAAVGYHRAGFDEIVGVDIVSQPNYPFGFVQADALEFLAEHGHEFDVIHASPPCQGYSIMHNLPWLRGRDYPRLIKPVRDLLARIERPWVIENVMGARWGCKNLVNISALIGYDITDHGMRANYLCGSAFGRPFYRHRLFETNWIWLAPGHPKHIGVIRPGPMFGSNGGRLAQVVFPDGTKQSFGRGALLAWQNNGAKANGVGVGHAKDWRLAAEAMGIDWMKREELTQAIPPAYTEFIGRQLLTRRSPR